MRLSIKIAALATVGLVGVFIFLPVWACGCKVAGPSTACMSNLKQLSLGQIQYASDHDDRLTNRDLWMDQIAPYVKEKSTFVEPLLKDKGFGYAYNAALSNAKLPGKSPEKTPMVYDSLNPIKNASDLVTSLPAPGRHGGKNNIAYVDGHAKRIPALKP